MKLFDLPLASALFLAALPLLLACAASGDPPKPARVPPAAPAPGAPQAVRDPHSFARPDEAAVDHLKLTLRADFASRTLAGRASLHLAPHAGLRLHLDTRDLDIRGVTLDDGRTPAAFRLGDPVRFLGRDLEVEITPQTQWVNVDYATLPESAALQWLSPEQAGGGKPFLYSQSEAILARTWIPCQDTPGVRMTYEATVAVPPDLLAVMSAENPQAKRADGVYSFRMPQPIPSYLLALAVGDLEFRPFSSGSSAGNSGVYAQPAVIERAAWELADTPRMIAAAERLYGPYRWGRYDLLVLPASYPFGGMENPRLTFATPTILAGDRSLVALVAHELAHSWSGNLVTNATWNDFWLNEGFTVYFERRIVEALYGRPLEEMEAALGRESLEETLTELGRDSPDTRLHLDMAGRDPDDAVNDVAYEKGALFLRALDEAAGRDRFDRFLRGWFDAHAFRSMDTAGFVAYLNEHLLAGDPKLAAAVDADAWIERPGLPASAPKVTSAAFARVDQQAAALAAGTPPERLATQGWTAQEWLHFLRQLARPVPAATMAALDAAFHLTASGNDEILTVWLERAIQSHYEPAYPTLEKFLLAVGRRKLVKPLYSELAKTPAGTEMALRIYGQARPGYHALTQQMVDRILDWRG
jgi:leukotriene-A4 hydrolase